MSALGTTVRSMDTREEARAVASDLREAVRHLFGDELVAMILYGSAVTGGFDAGVSDIDLIAVTASPVASLDIDALGRVHRDIVRRWPTWEDRIEVVYVGHEALIDFRTTAEELIVISPGEPLHRTGPATDWIQNWYLARTTGVPIVGGSPGELIPPIAADEFLEGIRRYLAYLATTVSADRAPGRLAYAVLSAARGACTLSMSTPASKQQGADWLRSRRRDWAEAIDEALATRLRRGKSGFADPRLREAAASLVSEIASGSRTADSVEQTIS